MTDDIAGLIERLKHVAALRIPIPAAGVLSEAADALSRLSQQVAELDLERDQAVSEAHCYRERRANDAYEMKRLSSERDKANERIAELESQFAARESAEPYCYIYEYDHKFFGLHRQFESTEWNAMKPTRTVAVYAHPPAATASEPVWCQSCGDGITSHDPGICGTCFAVKYRDRPAESASEEKRTLTPHEVEVLLGDQMYIDRSQHYRNGTITLTIRRKPRDAAIAAEKGGSTS